MTFQSTVNIFNAIGVVGDLAFSGPIRAIPYNLNSDTGYPNVIGRAFTVLTGGVPTPTGAAPNAGSARAGGTGPFAGILVNPKAYVTAGTGGNALAPTLTLPDNAVGELLQMGEIFVAFPGAAAIGDKVFFDNTTGELGTTGAIAGTATQSGTVLTVATSTGGNIGVGSVISVAGAAQVTVVSLGTGTGGTGTYNVNFSQTVGSAAAITGTPAAPTGKTLVPNCEVAHYGLTGAGVGVIKLTN